MLNNNELVNQLTALRTLYHPGILYTALVKVEFKLIQNAPLTDVEESEVSILSNTLINYSRARSIVLIAKAKVIVMQWLNQYEQPPHPIVILPEQSTCRWTLTHHIPIDDIHVEIASDTKESKVVEPITHLTLEKGRIVSSLIWDKPTSGMLRILDRYSLLGLNY